MTVLRITPNIAGDPKATTFYENILGLSVIMDQGWIKTLIGDGTRGPQLSIALEGGSGTDVPDISIEVDDLDVVIARLEAANHPILYGPVIEPWGLRRLYVKDPFGKILNILQHV